MRTLRLAVAAAVARGHRLVEHPMQRRDAFTVRARSHDESACLALYGPGGPAAAVVLDRDERSQLMLDRGVIHEGEPQAVGGLLAADAEVRAEVDPPFALVLQIGVGERAGDEFGEILLRRQVGLIDGHSCSFRWWVVGPGARVLLQVDLMSRVRLWWLAGSAAWIRAALDADVASCGSLSCDAREPPVAAGRLAAVPRERTVEGVLGRVSDLAGDADRFGGVLQSLRRAVSAPARKVRQRKHADDLGEATRERR